MSISAISMAGDCGDLENLSITGLVSLVKQPLVEELSAARSPAGRVGAGGHGEDTPAEPVRIIGRPMPQVWPAHQLRVW